MNDYLDELNQQADEAERAAHEAGECWRDCAYCEHALEAEQWRRECEERRVFDRLFGDMQQWLRGRKPLF